MIPVQMQILISTNERFHFFFVIDLVRPVPFRSFYIICTLCPSRSIVLFSISDSLASICFLAKSKTFFPFFLIIIPEGFSLLYFSGAAARGRDDGPCGVWTMSKEGVKA